MSGLICCQVLGYLKDFDEEIKKNKENFLDILNQLQLRALPAVQLLLAAF